MYSYSYSYSHTRVGGQAGIVHGGRVGARRGRREHAADRLARPDGARGGAAREARGQPALPGHVHCARARPARARRQVGRPARARQPVPRRRHLSHLATLTRELSHQRSTRHRCLNSLRTSFTYLLVLYITVYCTCEY